MNGSDSRTNGAPADERRGTGGGGGPGAWRGAGRGVWREVSTLVSRIARFPDGSRAAARFSPGRDASPRPLAGVFRARPAWREDSATRAVLCADS